MRKIVALLLIFFVMLSPLDRVGANANQASSWAQASIDRLRAIGGFDESLLLKPKALITRGEFVSLVVRAYELLTSQEVIIDKAIGFSDTNDPYALKGATIGITNGVGNNRFGFSDNITREQMATMYLRMLKTLNIDLFPRGGSGFFADHGNISSWAEESVYLARANGIFAGDNANRFAPKDFSTVEMAIVITDRVLRENNGKRVQLRTGRNKVADIYAPMALDLVNIYSQGYNVGFDRSSYIFSETFLGKNLSSNAIFSSEFSPLLRLDSFVDQANYISDSGELVLGGSRHLQFATFNREILKGNRDYGIDFRLSIESMGNEGAPHRPIFVLIPRMSNSTSKSGYAVTYYLEIGPEAANLYTAKWGIHYFDGENFSPPLAEASYPLLEDVSYNVRFSIETLIDSRVELKLFIDGIDKPYSGYEPLLRYVDSSANRITNNLGSIAFGTSGYRDAWWGHNPIIRLSDVKVVNIGDFSAKTIFLRSQALNQIATSSTSSSYNRDRYLIQSGIVPSSYLSNLNSSITIAELVSALMYTLDYRAEPLDKALELGIISAELYGRRNQNATRYDTSIILEGLTGFRPIQGYGHVIKDAIPSDLKTSVELAYQRGYFKLDSSNRFNGATNLRTFELLEILDRILNPHNLRSNKPLELVDIFSDGMVLQRNAPIRVFGYGMSGDRVIVNLAGEQRSADVVDGKWSVELQSRQASGPLTMQVSDSYNRIEVKDIYVGEVFIVAGQSNAEMYLTDCNNGAAIRNKYMGTNRFAFYKNDQLISFKPNNNAGGEWRETEGWALDYASALGVFFGDKLFELNESLRNVKIGIINLTYGGTTIELFTSPEYIYPSSYYDREAPPILSGFWNGFIGYLAPFNVKGVLYYQGENSAHHKDHYEELLRNYISGLRSAFKNPSLPIFLVGLSAYGINDYAGDRDMWPSIREAQMRVANTTYNVELVTALDLADEDPIEIHPAEKQEISHRIAHIASEKFYGRATSYKSPTLSGLMLQNGIYKLSFNAFNKALTISSGISGFEIKGSDGVWRYAKAQLLQDNTIEVWLEGEINPEGIRYGWRNFPHLGVFDSDGLPLLPFNTDKPLNVVNPRHRSNETELVISNHYLRDYDAIVNLSLPEEILRVVELIDASRVRIFFPNIGQKPGDLILKLRRIGNGSALAGTDIVTIKLTDHGLSVGDYIRNNTRGWTARRVIRVIDNHNFEVMPIFGQTVGDDIEMFKAIEWQRAQ